MKPPQPPQPPQPSEPSEQSASAKPPKSPRPPRPSPDVVRAGRTAAGLAWRSGRGALLLYLAGSVVAGLLPAAAALLVRELFDAITRHRPTDDLVRVAVLLVAVSLGIALVPAVTDFLREQHARRVQLRVQDELFEGVNRLPGLRHFEDPAFQDELRLAQEAGSSAPGMLIGSFVGGVQALVTFLGFLVTVCVLNPWLGALTVVMALPTFRTQLTAGRRRAAVIRDIVARSRRQLFYASLLTDTDAVKEIRLFGLQDHFKDRARAELAAASEAERRTELRNLVRGVPPSVLGVAVYGAGLVWVVRAVGEGTLSVGDVSVFLAATAAIQTGVGQLASTGSNAYQALLTFVSYRALRDMAPDLRQLDGPAEEPRPLRSSITFENVWFRYDDTSPWVLRGVDLTLSAGTTTALVGLNGAGKSTLVKLLCRLYDPTVGRILWDGTDLRAFAPDELRRRIGVVFQDYGRYDLTASENVGLGRLDRAADPEAVTAAARAAGIHDRLSRLPAGYSTLLSRIFVPEGEQGGFPGSGGPSFAGQSLSGGEWQRVAVARAFMRADADLMILDEPSAGLDAEAEKEIHDSLRTLRRGATGVVISHRLGAVRDAGSIVVLGDGRIVEEGTHRELMERGGRYAELFELQADGYRPEAPGAGTAPVPGSVPVSAVPGPRGEW
ncbi:ABC transporter ATP-binding protein [Streptomyces griseus]|uniref:ABC transporter ATP-binding protein n=1 Tax=Streptomyces griseus TaxID=1911 RepID=UPI00099D5F40|nr:ABC transporter ATP-binding protein [Streptomyces griseus]